MSSVLDREISAAEVEDDMLLLSICHKQRLDLPSSPSQSNFRVYALLIISCGDIASPKYYLIHGTNAEASSYIGSSICAERSALTKLRFYQSPRLLKVVISTDNESPISPGLLCREWLCSYVDLDLKNDVEIILTNCTLDIISKCGITFLYPHPYLYRQCRRESIEDFATNIAKTLPVDVPNDVNKLLKHTVEYTKQDKSNIHPIKFAASILFSDGTIKSAAQIKALEYSCSLDPITQLVTVLDSFRICSECDDERVQYTVEPVLLVFCDQYGIAHAPFGQGRALLIERGHLNIPLYINTYESSTKSLSSKIITSGELIPPPPNGKMLSHDDFE